MVWLNWPPEEWPNSAENWFCRTVKLSTASLGMVISGPVTERLLLSTPSTVKLLLRGRTPETVGPDPTPTPPLLATPASSRDRLRTPLFPCPPAVIGKSAASLERYVEAIVGVVESTVTPVSLTSM